MRYLIFGSGAVGSYLGVRLALSGQPVSFLARERHQATLRQRGFCLHGEGPPQALYSSPVYTDPAQAIQAETPELILLTVKAYDVVGAAQALAPLLNRSRSVVSFLNGVSNETALAERLGKQRILPATLTTAVQLPAPGEIRVARTRGVGLAGDHPLLPAFLADLKHAGFRVRRYASSEDMKWSKLLTNIVSNATSAILGWTPKQVFDHPRMARLEIQALREAVRVMRRLGAQPHDLPGVQVSLLARAVFLPPWLIRKPLGRIVGRGRGEKPPSFHYDIGRGRSEVGWLNGAIVTYGQRLGVATPVNRMLTETLLTLVQHASLQQDYLDQPEALLRRLPG